LLVCLDREVTCGDFRSTTLCPRMRLRQGW